MRKIYHIIINNKREEIMSCAGINHDLPFFFLVSIFLCDAMLPVHKMIGIDAFNLSLMVKDSHHEKRHCSAPKRMFGNRVLRTPI